MEGVLKFNEVGVDKMANSKDYKPPFVVCGAGGNVRFKNEGGISLWKTMLLMHRVRAGAIKRIPKFIKYGYLCVKDSCGKEIYKMAPVSNTNK